METKRAATAAEDTTRTTEPAPAPVMFDEGRFFLELQNHMDRSFSSFKREVHEDIRSALKKHADTSFQEHEKTRRHVAALTTKVDKVWHKVYGEPPDPPSEDISFALTEPSTNPGHHPAQKSIPEKMSEHEAALSEHDATLAGIQGQIIALDAKTNTALDAIHGKVDALTSLQKEQMGLRDEDDRKPTRKLLDGVIWLVGTRAGRKFALTLTAALTSLITALGTSYALYTGRLPLPSSPPVGVHQP